MNFSVPKEEPFTFQAIADANGVHHSTVSRWASNGVGGVKLQTFRRGGRRFVWRRALEEFDRALNGSQSNQDDEFEKDSVDEELEAEGL